MYKAILYVYATMPDNYNILAVLYFNNYINFEFNFQSLFCNTQFI